MNQAVRDALEFFIAGLPARIIFGMDSRNALELVNDSKRSKDESRRDRLVEVCLIGLASYFEAFCKNQFASIINICPQTLYKFTQRRDNATVKLPHLVSLIGEIDHKLGSLLAEEYDFGSSRTINSLYFDLLGITPLSKDEEDLYTQFLNDRNLLVHHGGVYTIRYHGQRFRTQPIRNLVHWNSLTVSPEDFRKWHGFLNALVDKIADSSLKALNEFVTREHISLKRVNKKAIFYLAWKNDD
jgi:hypothetical protein